MYVCEIRLLHPHLETSQKRCFLAAICLCMTLLDSVTSAMTHHNYFARILHSHGKVNMRVMALVLAVFVRQVRGVRFYDVCRLGPSRGERNCVEVRLLQGQLLLQLVDVQLVVVSSFLVVETVAALAVSLFRRTCAQRDVTFKCDISCLILVLHSRLLIQQISFLLVGDFNVKVFNTGHFLFLVFL